MIVTLLDKDEGARLSGFSIRAGPPDRIGRFERWNDVLCVGTLR